MRTNIKKDTIAILNSAKELIPSETSSTQIILTWDTITTKFSSTDWDQIDDILVPNLIIKYNKSKKV